MPPYTLKFYRRKSDTPGDAGMRVTIVEADDQAAIDFVQAEYAPALQDTPFAVLVDAEDRELWRHGSPNPAPER